MKGKFRSPFEADVFVQDSPGTGTLVYLVPGSATVVLGKIEEGDRGPGPWCLGDGVLCLGRLHFWA